MKKWLKNSMATLFAIGALAIPTLGSAQSCAPERNCYDPCDWDTSNFFFTSSTLYWKTCANRTDYAVTGTGFVGNVLIDGKTHDVDMDWDWGFRLGVGYQFPCNGWDFRVNWTRLHTHDHSSTSLPTGTNPTVQGNIMNPFFGDPDATSATARNRINYDTLDILFSRLCCVCDDLTVRPFFGARILWLDQKFNARYTGSGTGSIFTGDDDGVDWNSSYTAGGLHTGMEFLVDLGCDFYLVANAAASLVAGDNDGKQEQRSSITTEGTITRPIDIKDDDSCLVTFGYELSLGAKYKTCLCECWNIDWGLTYDFVYWDRVPELVRYTDSVSIANSAGGHHGSLGFHGVSFSSVWRF